MPGRGGARSGAGRPKGSKDKATREAGATIGELARGYTDLAIKTLAEIATQGESDAARVSAANALLDRGYGKPAQSVDHSSTDGSMSPKANIDATKLSTAAMAEILNASSDAS